MMCWASNGMLAFVEMPFSLRQGAACEKLVLRYCKWVFCFPCLDNLKPCSLLGFLTPIVRISRLRRRLHL